MADIDDYLHGIFAAHGVSLEPRDGWLASPQTYPCCRSYVHEPRQYDTHCSVRLDVEVALNNERIVIESFGDAGATPSDALANACHNFTGSSLHVLLSAVWDRHEDEQVLRETWSTETGDWTVYLGNLVRKAAGIADVPVPRELVPAIESLFKSTPLPRDVHWMRIYYANMSLDDKVVEVLLDNETWEHAQDTLRQIKWPAMNAFYSTRMFLMMIPDQLNNVGDQTVPHGAAGRAAS